MQKIAIVRAMVLGGLVAAGVGAAAAGTASAATGPDSYMSSVSAATPNASIGTASTPDTREGSITVAPDGTRIWW